MRTVQEIESAITQLKPKEVHAVTDWLLRYRETLWDEQIAADARGGKLDSLIKKAKAGHRAGKATPRRAGRGRSHRGDRNLRLHRHAAGDVGNRRTTRQGAAVQAGRAVGRYQTGADAPSAPVCVPKIRFDMDAGAIFVADRLSDSMACMGIPSASKTGNYF